MREPVKEKKVQKRYDEEFKRQAVELVIHSGKTQAQIARELGVSEYSLTLWKKDYLGHLKPGQLDGPRNGIWPVSISQSVTASE
jgi:transposase-like protein